MKPASQTTRLQSHAHILYGCPMDILCKQNSFNRKGWKNPSTKALTWEAENRSSYPLKQGVEPVTPTFWLTNVHL